MYILILLLSVLSGIGLVDSHRYGHEAAAHSEDLNVKLGSEWPFSGISTFAHLPSEKCLLHPDFNFDIGIIGAPFDSAVSYRPGARFGPRAIRAASARQIPYRAFNARAGINPYQSWANIVDCGDVPITPFDKVLAEKQMTEAYLALGQRSPSSSFNRFPKLISLGGDHSIALPAIRALRQLYDEPIAVVHFDAHLDTWDPSLYPSAWISSPDPYDPDAAIPPSWFNHGSMFWLAHREGLLASSKSSTNSSACCNVHAGLRCRLSKIEDHVSDTAQGWTRISADMIDDIGAEGVARLVVSSLGDPKRPVYLSIDIDVLDPGLAPGTGTPEPGGWTSRELIRIVRSLESLNIVGADIVEVAPAYDGAGEETALAAAQLVFELITNIVKKGLASRRSENVDKAQKDEL